jgi:hypothetical protein
MTLRRKPLLLLLGGAIAVVVALVVWWSPRPRGFDISDVPGAKAPRELVSRADSRLGVQPASVVSPVSRTRTDSMTDGRLDVPLADKIPASLPASGAPSGWSVKEFAGQADVELARIDGRLALRLRSDRSSFALYRDVVVDLAELPVLTWTWKVLKLPAGGDGRLASRNDQAAGVYVVFPRWPSPLTRSDVIGYIWDTSAPADTSFTHPRVDNIKLIVVESGRQQMGQWRRHQRNLADDYAALFNRKPPRVGKVAVMSDSNDTRTDAEALISSLGFSRAR